MGILFSQSCKVVQCTNQFFWWLRGSSRLGVRGRPAVCMAGPVLCVSATEHVSHVCQPVFRTESSKWG